MFWRKRAAASAGHFEHISEFRPEQLRPLCRDVWAGPKANPNDKWVVAAFVAGYILNLYWYASAHRSLS